MSCVYTLKTEGDCLLAEIEGTVSSIHDLFDFDQAILKEAERLGLRKMLRDVRKVAFENLYYDDVISFMEKRLALADRSKRLVIAAVLSSKDRELGKMIEAAAITRSFNLKTFLDYDEALAWLEAQ